jgi:hypothetical protein
MRENLKLRCAPIVLIGLVSVVLYLNSLNNSFHFDDLTGIVEILVYFISRNLLTLALEKIGSLLDHKMNPEDEEINL